MKKLNLTLVLFTLLQVVAFGQKSKTYKWLSIVQIEECDADGNSSGTGFVASPVGSLFKIQKSSNDEIVFYFLNWGKTVGGNVLVDPQRKEKFETYNLKSGMSALLASANGSVSIAETQYINNVKFFKVSSKKFEEEAEELQSKLAFGALTLPYKLRIQGGMQFESDFPLGVAITHKFLSSNKWLLIASFGYSKADLDNENASKLAIGATAKDLRTFSVATGVMYKVGDIQLVGVLGRDMLSKNNQDKYDWRYNSKTWVGIGIGVSIFSLSKNEKEQK